MYVQKIGKAGYLLGTGMTKFKKKIRFRVSDQRYATLSNSKDMKPQRISK